MRRTVNQTAAWVVSGMLIAPVAGAATGDSTNQLTSIIVVGQKENQGLQVAPEAITAITPDVLAQSDVQNATDLNGIVPGLVIGESDGYNFDLTIRGIGLNSPQDDGSPASVSLHQNGFFIPNPLALSLGFLDLDHLEVLRGPQGTVFGQNSVGGTLNIITVQPTLDVVKGYADAEFGSLDLVHLRTAINLPVSSTLALRFAGDFDKQDGYVTATALPNDFKLNDVNNYHVRLSALLQPNDDFSVIGSIEYAKVVQHEPESKNILDPNPNPWQETSDWPGVYDMQQTIATLTATWNFSATTFKSLSSLQYMNEGGSNSESGLTIALATPLFGGENDQYVLHENYAVSQEFDLSSKPGGPLDWVLGGFYLHSRITDAYSQYLLNPSMPEAPDTIGLSDPVGEALSLPEFNAGTLYFETLNALRRTSASLFGQGTYHVNDQLRTTAGFRYTVDGNTTLLDNYFGDPNEGGGIVRFSEHSSKLTWKLGLEDQLTPDNLLYGSVSTGYKPGGGNPGTAPLVVPHSYVPETITAFEVGSKNSVLNRTFVANLAAFYYIDKDMQYHAEDAINFDGGVDNLPEVQIYGIEGEFTALLPAHFRLDAFLTDQRGHITSHVSTIDNLTGNTINNQFAAQYGEAAFLAAEFGYTDPALPNAQQLLTAQRLAGYRDVYGNSPPNLPQYMAQLALSQTSKFADGSSLLSRYQLTYRDQYADTVFGNSFYYTTPSYVMMNLFFDYTFANRNLDLTLGVSNIANRAEVSYRFTNQYGGETTQTWFPPREYRIGIGYKF
jgi:iron complex outermembrane receptor protein